MKSPVINMVLDVAINTDINANIFISKAGYYVPLVMRIYYSLNGIIGPNVLNIGLVYLLLT